MLKEMQEWLMLKDFAQLAATTDLVHFSHWLCANLPASDATRLSLLELDCPHERLYDAVSLLRQFRSTTIACVFCSAILSSANDVFCMSEAGLMNAFVNPHGLSSVPHVF
jgi:hypothetical protein